MPSVNNGPSSSTTPNTLASYTVVNTNGLPQPQQWNAIRLLAVARGINVNGLGDMATMQIINATNWTPTAVVLTGASISLTTAAAGIFTQPAAGGITVRDNAALSALTGPTVTNLAAPNAASTARNNTEQVLYFNVATAQGAAATLDAFVFGYDLSPPVG